MLTRSTEDYLKQIYHLQSSGQRANTGSLAGLLGISPASVSEMVGKLSSEGWITNKPYHGCQLTKKGEGIALNLVRKHRMIEVFLQQHLKYEWDEVHSEAERLEHVVSDSFINKLEEYLGNPKYDPHGDPIPDKNGKISATHYILLTKSAAGKNYVIAKVNDASKEILQYLAKIGLRLNSHITVNEKIEFDGSVLISHDGKKHLLSKTMAELISVV
jgi:DtxR family transcriptional regulator, Mn-dependent transcriptional regulator